MTQIQQNLVWLGELGSATVRYGAVRPVGVRQGPARRGMAS